MYRRLIHIIIVAVALMCALHVGAAPRRAAERPFTLVIDPGHGGKDTGCRGKLADEKTIVLDVGRRLGRIIAREHPEVKMVYTRDGDYFVELNRRAAIANDANADLFISIHVNSVDARSRGRENIHGASVYTLGLHRTDDNLAVAMRENAVIELEPDFSETYQGFDPSSSESYIIFELTQNRHQQNSIELAEGIQRGLVSTAGRADKGVRQAGFLVLRATSMAAVLVELDFICNRAAERFLASEDGRQQCARSIADAFAAYYARHRRGDSSPQQPSSPEAAPAPAREVYAVQILTSPTQLSPDDPRIARLADVHSYVHEGVHKYVVGQYTDLKTAKKSLRKLKKSFAGAFIIKMRDGQRLP